MSAIYVYFISHSRPIAFYCGVSGLNDHGQAEALGPDGSQGQERPAAGHLECVGCMCQGKAEQGRAGQGGHSLGSLIAGVLQVGDVTSLFREEGFWGEVDEFC